MTSIVENTKYISDLTKNQIDFMTKAAEKAIREEKLEQSKMQDDYNSAKQMFEEVKAKWDIHQDIIDQAESTIISLNRFKTGKKLDTQQRIYKGISNTLGVKDKKKNKAKTVRWIAETIEQLKITNQFMDAQNIVDQVSKRKPEIDEINRSLPEKELKKRKYYIADQASKGFKELVMYNDKVGLAEWINSDGSIHPDKLKVFMG